MAKLAQSVAKYNIRASLEANGVVEKPDVIGAVFGQTEGLLGNDMDLRELQRTGRIGRIEVNVDTKSGKSKGTILIPSSLDSAETTLIAATLETIERIGPCEAKIKVEAVEDLRDHKRDYVINRAKELLSKLAEKNIPESEEITEKIKEALRVEEVIDFQGCPAGPGVLEGDEIIVVEGRADVVNLLKQGIKNAIAAGGTGSSATPSLKAIGDLSKEKTTTVFLDGDRGGDLILKELKQYASIDFVARAPEGKEVEELTKKEVFKSLREKTPLDQAKLIDDRSERREQPREERYEDRRQRFGGRDREYQQREMRGESAGRRVMKTVKLSDEAKAKLLEVSQDIVGTRAVCIFDENLDVLGRVPLTELDNALKQVRGIYAIAVDGPVDRTFIKRAERYKIQLIVAESAEDAGRTGVTVLTTAELV